MIKNYRENAKELDQRINQLKTDFHGKTQIMKNSTENQTFRRMMVSVGRKGKMKLNQLSFSLDQKNRA